MIENQIGSSILTIKTFDGWVKWFWLKCGIGSSFKGYNMCYENSQIKIHM